MKYKITVLPQNKWPKRNPRCEADCVSSGWYYRHHGEFQQCKYESMYKYRGKHLCSRHLGYLLIEEKIHEQQ